MKNLALLLTIAFTSPSYADTFVHGKIKYGNICRGGNTFTKTILQPVGSMCYNVNGGNVGKISDE